MHAPSFVADLATVLAVASVTALVFGRLRQPAVLGYLVAGLVVGPYIPIPVFADAERIHALSELGVVLVMFVVGLELRLRRLLEVLPTAGATALFEVTAMIGCGYAVGRGLGWDVPGAVFLGASIAISSTMVVSKVFAERPVSPDVKDHVMSVLVIQDVLAIVLAAVLTAVAAGQGLSPGELLGMVGRLSGVLLAIVAVGLLTVPRLIRAVVGTGSKELLVVLAVGICFGLAQLAEELGYSVALGAFLAGVLVAESGQGAKVEHLVQSLRDIFAAIFFVAIGMSVDPAVALRSAGTSLLVFAVVLVAQLASVSSIGILSGNGLRRSVQAGLALGQVGEFGFILAAIGIQAGVAPAELGPIVVTVAMLTTFTTPLAVGASDRIVRGLDHALPRRLQLLLSLYEAWFEQLRAPPKAGSGSGGRRLVLALGLEAAAILGVVVATALGLGALRHLARSYLGLAAPLDTLLVLAGATLLAAPPLVGFLRATTVLSRRFGERVFGIPEGDGRRRIRHVFELSLRLLLLLVVGVPCAVIVAPILGDWLLTPVLLVAVPATLALWRTAGRAAGPVRSSAERLVDLLARQTSDDRHSIVSNPHGLLGLDRALGVALGEDSPGVGRTLAELDLRATTGATVVAIRSPDAEHRVPTGHEPLHAGDVLAIVGSTDATDRAREVLLGPSDARPPSPPD
ncbi:MAG: cation:proton antiporter [Sandaracinaceae bacterium]